jgi:glyoxylase-like metal-dependent hydrolase (beta-lactamase superfamily II)
MIPERVVEGVYRLRTLMVNVYFVSAPAQSWFLIDAGLPGFTGAIREAAARLFSGPPLGILLTHGHFDHVGALPRLSDEWGVPVYAHPLEMPYLRGESPYPPPDPTVGGGTQSWLSPLFPRGPINLGAAARMLPPSGAVPALPDWEWLPTPGHTPGHVSFYRPSDRTLIAGDAVVTARQESTLGVLTQEQMVWRPPAYYTCDWIAARRSVERMAMLDPEVLATGHGRPMHGQAVRDGLRTLAMEFDRVMPSTGRYVPFPAVTDEHGIVHVPPRPPLAPSARAAIGVGAVGAVALGVAMFAVTRRRR